MLKYVFKPFNVASRCFDMFLDPFGKHIVYKKNETYLIK